jgi:predicted RND superfamily exporter protein
MEERAENGPGITPQLILGLAIVAVGVLFTLDNLGWIESRGYWSYWPVLLIILGLAKACQSKNREQSEAGGRRASSRSLLVFRAATETSIGGGGSARIGEPAD